MATALPKDAAGGTERQILELLAEQRLAEFHVMVQARQFATAMYLGGYACECYLKARICRLLEVDRLPKTFHSHDLEALLLHSGLSSRIKSAGAVEHSFKRIVSVWNDNHGQARIRYDDPVGYDETAALDFMSRLIDPNEGVVPWFKKQP